MKNQRRGAAFESFMATTEELGRNRDAVKRFCDEERTGKLFLIGGCGTGKTHLACAAVRHFRGAIYTMFEMVLSLKSAYDGGPCTENDVMERLSNVTPLAIDESGRIKDSEWEMNCLSHFVSVRHENCLPTLFVSNGHFRKRCDRGGCEKCLDNCLDANILSRVSEDCGFLGFYGEDFREIEDDRAERFVELAGWGRGRIMRWRRKTGGIRAFRTDVYGVEGAGRTPRHSRISRGYAA